MHSISEEVVGPHREGCSCGKWCDCADGRGRNKIGSWRLYLKRALLTWPYDLTVRKLLDRPTDRGFIKHVGQLFLDGINAAHSQQPLPTVAESCHGSDKSSIAGWMLFPALADTLLLIARI